MSNVLSILPPPPKPRFRVMCAPVDGARCWYVFDSHNEAKAVGLFTLDDALFIASAANKAALR